jgi:hypothetical protein
VIRWYCATLLVYDLVSIHVLCKSNHDYYSKWIKSSNIILSVIISYTFRLFNFSYWHYIIDYATVLLWYCDAVLPFYWSTVIPWYCTSVRLSVYSWLVQVQPWLLSKMHKRQRYHFVCNNIIYLQTINFFLLALNHLLFYSSIVILWCFHTVILGYHSTVVLCYCSFVLPFFCITLIIW